MPHPPRLTAPTKAADRRPGFKRVNVEFPLALLAKIDHEAARLGIARQVLIRLRLAEALPDK